MRPVTITTQDGRRVVLRESTSYSVHARANLQTAAEHCAAIARRYGQPVPSCVVRAGDATGQAIGERVRAGR